MPEDPPGTSAARAGTLSRQRRGPWRTVPRSVITHCRVHFSLVLDRYATLEPWLPDWGWAMPGRTWLREGSVTGMVFSEGIAAFTLQAAETFTVRLPDGTAIPAQAFADTPGIVPERLAFSVPAGFTRGTLVIEPKGLLLVSGKPGHWTHPLPVERMPLIAT